MEKVIGIDKLRPKLGEYLKEVEKGDVIIVSSRSEPKGVLISYSMYNQLKEFEKKAKQLEIMQILNEFRDKAEKAGLSEKDVEKEIKEVRK